MLEKELEQWIAHIRKRVTVPLRLALWNGKVFDFSSGRPLVTLRVPHVTSLPYLLSPSLSNLGEAYVEGDRKSTRLNSSHIQKSRMPSSA